MRHGWLWSPCRSVTRLPVGLWDLEPQESLVTYLGAQDIYGQQEPEMQVPGDNGDIPPPGSRARSKSAATNKARRATAKDAGDSTDKTKKDREQKVIAAGRDRWKQTNPKLTPEITTGEHFVLFSNLPKDRAANALKVAEAQYSQLKRLLGAPATDWVEKVSLYVFNNRKDFVEFARTIENREVDAQRFLEW